MITAPSTAFVDKINNGDVPFIRMQLTTSKGRSVIVEDGDFWADSVSFAEAVSQDGAFSVGSAIINSFSFSLTNFDRKFDLIDFGGAVVIPFIYYNIDGTKEMLPKGIFYVTSHVTSGNIIRCTAMDALKLFDQSQTPITYPITVQSLVETLCEANGITLETTTIPNGDFVLNAPVTQQEDYVMTDRQMLSYAVQCIGCFARMNEYGHLVVGWYDFQNAIQVRSTFDGKSLWTNPIVVTGIKVDIGNGSGTLMAVSVDGSGSLIYMRTSNVSDTFTVNDKGELIAIAEDGVVYQLVDEQLIRTGEEIVAPEGEEENQSVSILYGTDDRVIRVEDNPYITVANVARICEIISKKTFGYGIRPGTLPVLSNPCLQAGDALKVTDNVTGVSYTIPITSTTYGKGLVQNVICAFEDKEDQDLRPNSNYNMRLSVENALKQAQQADDLAKAAHDLAETSGFEAFVVSDAGSGFDTNKDVHLTATIYDKEMSEVDTQGTDYIYRWWITQDGVNGRYLDGGKNITVFVSDAMCEYTAGIYFETRDKDDGIYPFSLANRNGLVLTTRDGVPLTARAATRYAT